jgi:aminoglycoside phosphotransferase family enzyme
LCAAEVRVNRRLAPSVYLGVVAVVPRSDGGLAVDWPGAAGAV